MTLLTFGLVGFKGYFCEALILGEMVAVLFLALKAPLGDT